MLYRHLDLYPTLAPTATLAGDVTLGENVSVWYGAVLRGDVASVRVGANTNIQDNAVVHVGTDRPAVIGENVTVGHGAIVHGCTVENSCLIGMGAILLSGCVIGEGSIVAAGALVTEGAVIPPGSLVMGSPGRVRRALDGSALEENLRMSRKYMQLAADQLPRFNEHG